MQRSSTRLSSQLLPACWYILHPTSCFVGQSIRVRNSREQHSVGIGSCSVSLNSHRNYIRDVDRSGERPRNDTKKDAINTKKDAIILNKRITDFGKRRKWKEILKLVEKEKNRVNNVNWATAFSQLGRIRNLDRRDPLFKSFVQEYATCLESRGLQWAGIREVSNVVYIIGKMQLKNQATKSILEFVSKKENACKIVEEGSAQEVANVAWAFAKLGIKKSHTLFAEIEAGADWLVTEGTPQAVANTAWAFATLNIESPKLFAAIDTRADWFVNNGKPQEIANTAWALATLDIKSPKLFTEIEARADWFITNAKPQEVANTAWAFAILDVKSPMLFAEIESCADSLVEKGTPQAVANTAWAFATLDVKSPKLFAEIEKRAEWLVTNGKPQEVANTAWALATLGVKSSKFFIEIENRADWLVTNGTPQAVANTAWACAKLNMKSPKLFAGIETRANWLVTNGTPQAVANTSWAFATLDVKSHNFFSEIEARADWLVSNGKPQEVANTFWAASHFQYHSKNLIQNANLFGAWLVKEGSTQAISNSAIAFANYGYDAAIFFKALTNNVTKLINEGNQQEIINVCYALAILDLGHKYSDALCQLWDTAINLDTAFFLNEELLQLGQVLAFCKANGITLQKPSALLTQKIGAVVPDSAQSNYQREVAAILGKLGLDYEEEVSPFEGSEMDNRMLSIDFACKSQMLAIECHGDSHFLRELGTGKVTQVENGATKAKRHFLEQMGWKVINIAYLDWMDAKNESCRLEFLRGKLSEREIPLNKVSGSTLVDTMRLRL